MPAFVLFSEMGQELCSCAGDSTWHTDGDLKPRSSSTLDVALSSRQARAPPPLPSSSPPTGTTPLSTSLWFACEAGELETVKRLVGRGAPVNHAPEDDELARPPLVVAIEQGHSIIVRYLASLPQILIDTPCGDGATPLFVACEIGDLELAQFLHAKGAKITVPNKQNQTPFHAAAEAGQLEVLRWLSTCGAKATGRDARQRTPLFAAVCHGQLTVVRYLCEGHGCDPDERDADCRTALWAACALGQLEEASYLLSLGATLEARDIDGRTPLLFAAESGNADVLRWCLAHGAHRDAVDNEGSNAEVRAITLAFRISRVRDGRTSLSQALAIANGHTACVQLLLPELRPSSS